MTKKEETHEDMDNLTEEVEKPIPMTEEQTPEELGDEVNILLRQFVGKGMGFGETSLKKLQAVGMNNVFDVCMRGSVEMTEITGMASHQVQQVMSECRNVVDLTGIAGKSIMTAREKYELECNVDVIAFEQPKIDELFNGGLAPATTYEIFGQFGSGKTQFCISAMVSALTQYEKNVVFVDCEGTLKMRRVVEMLKARNKYLSELEVMDYIDRIDVMDVHSTDELLSTMYKLSEYMRINRPKLLVADGSIGLFRGEYLGRGTLSARQNVLAKYMNLLEKMAYFFNCTVIYTNQVLENANVMFGDPIKAMGGHVVAHAATYRIYMKKPSATKRVLCMIDSPEHAITDLPIQVEDVGIVDV